MTALLIFRNRLSRRKTATYSFREVTEDYTQHPNMGGKGLVIFLHRLGLDGATNIVYQVLKQDFFRHWFKSITIISPFEGPMVTFFYDLGVNIKIAPYKSTPFRVGCQMLRQIRMILDGCEYIWMNTIDHPSHLVDLVEKSGKKTLLFGHESLRDNAPILKSVNFSETQLMSFRSLLKNKRNMAAFCSTSTVQYAREKFMSRKIEKIPGAIARSDKCDFERYRDLRKINFLVTGWVGERKNQASVIPVFHRFEKLYLHAKNLRDYSLTFVGSPYDLPEYKALIHESLKYLPAEKLCFFPMVTHKLMKKLLRRYHIVLIPSLGEALCVTALEMMATGGVLMHSDCEGSEDLIEHGRTGFLFKRENPDSLLKLLLEVLDPEIIRDQDFSRIGEEAFKKTSLFEEKKFASKVLNAITGSPFRQQRGFHSNKSIFK